ncbi:hypothetical protein CI41S_30530 [Bradyrhizobium ivorense]|nr:hypothetical protein CI41S_30530 [Bradyrhizobium ivorense]
MYAGKFGRFDPSVGMRGALFSGAMGHNAIAIFHKLCGR